MSNDGWEEVTDPTEARSVLGTDGAKRVLGLSGGAGGGAAPGGGRPLPQWAAKMADDEFAPYSALSRAANSFQDGYGGNVFGSLENTAQGLYSGIGTPGQRDWWADFNATDNQVRNKLFGAALTPHEIAAYASTTVTPSMDPKEIRANLARRQEIVKAGLQRRANFLQANGYDHDAIGALLGPNAADFGFGPQPASQGPAGQGKTPPIAATASMAGSPPPGPSAIAPASPSGAPLPFPAGPQTLATGATRTENVDQANSVINSLIRSGASNDQIYAALLPLGYGRDAKTDAQIQASRSYLAKNPNYQGSFGGAQKQVANPLWNRIAASPIGTGIYAGVDSALGGTTDEITGAINSLATGTSMQDAIADANRRKQLALATNPKAALVGDLVGGTASFIGAGKLLQGGAMATGLGRAAPYVGSAAFGAASGLGQNNDNRIGGAIVGGLGGAAGQGIGELSAIPIGALARSRPARAIQGMFGAKPAPSALSSAQRSTLDAITKVGPDNIAPALSDASRLGVPMSLADVSPEFRELAGAAVRRSPSAAAVAESTLLPRARGQFDRFSSSVERDLGPTANIPQTSADLGRQAMTDAAPLYEKAFEGGSIAPLESQFQDAFQGSSFAVSQAKRELADAQNALTQSKAGVSRAGDNVYGANAALSADRGASDAVARAEKNLADAQAEHDGNLARLRQAQADGSVGKAGAIWSPRIQQFLDDPISKAGLARGLEVQRLESLAAGKRFDPTELAITHFDDAGNPVVAAVPNMRTLDAVKRGFDEILNDYPRLPGGQLQLDQRGRAVDQVRKSMLGELDRLNSDYGAARAAYAGPVASRDALMRGQSMYSLSPDAVGMAAQTQTPEHLAQMQLGYRGALMDHAGRVRDSSNPWEATLGTPNARGRIDALYPNNPGNADLFRQRDLEGQMANTTNAILGNSKTAQRQMADEAFGTSSVPAIALDTALAAHGGIPVATLAKGAAHSRAAGWIKDRVSRGAVRKADEILPMLINPDPSAAIGTVDDVLKRAADYDRYVRQSRPTKLGGMFGSALGFSVGSRL